MNRSFRWLRRIAVIAIILIGVGVYVAIQVLSAGGFDSQRDKLPLEDPASILEPGVVSVTTSPATVRTVQRSIETVGTLHGYEEVSIASKIEGRVLKISHDISDRVKPDDVLLEIDPTDAELNVKQSERSLQVELARLGLTEPPAKDFDLSKLPSVAQAAIRSENAKVKLDRATKGGLAVSNEEISERRTEFRLAEVECQNQLLLAKASLATLHMRQESLAMARQQLKDATIRVPKPTQPIPGGESTGGTYAISSRNVSEGSFVRIGTEVFKLVIDQSLKLRVAVPERYTSQVELGQSVKVTSAAYPTHFAGLVKRINPSVDPTTRTFEVEIEVPNADRLLKPGGFAKAAILVRKDPKTMTVPLEAVVNFAGINKIFLIEEGKAREVQVSLGMQGSNWVEIVKPVLPENAVVVMTGQSALSQGTVVKVRTSEKPK